MKNYKQILEAVNRGIQLALDDFDDEEQVQHVKTKQVQNRDYTKEYLDFMEDVIDLGLPSGTKWFKYNFGVDYKKLDKMPKDSIPEDWYGDYYAWGELEPKKEYIRDNYKFYVKRCRADRYSGEYGITKYCSVPMCGFNSITDNIVQLQPEDDVIYRTFNNPASIKFNIPTKAQFKELVENTIKEKQTDFNGVKGLNGLLYTSKINGNSIFFPSTGNYDGTYHEGKNLVTLWTANMAIIEYNSHYATYFHGNSSTPFSSNARFCGYPVRPVVILKN